MSDVEMDRWVNCYLDSGSDVEIMGCVCGGGGHCEQLPYIVSDMEVDWGVNSFFIECQMWKWTGG